MGVAAPRAPCFIRTIEVVDDTFSRRIRLQKLTPSLERAFVVCTSCQFDKRFDLLIFSRRNLKTGFQRSLATQGFCVYVWVWRKISRMRRKKYVKACPHLFPKQETLYPETGDFVAENGNKVSCFGNKCGQALSMCETHPTCIRFYACVYA